MGGCDGCGVWWCVCKRGRETEREREIEQERMECSRCLPFARDAELRTAGRERRDEERKAERSGTRKERCEYMV